MRREKKEEEKKRSIKRAEARKQNVPSAHQEPSI